MRFFSKTATANPKVERTTPVPAKKPVPFGGPKHCKAKNSPHSPAPSPPSHPPELGRPLYRSKAKPHRPLKTKKAGPAPRSGRPAPRSTPVLPPLSPYVFPAPAGLRPGSVPGQSRVSPRFSPASRTKKGHKPAPAPLRSPVRLPEPSTAGWDHFLTLTPDSCPKSAEKATFLYFSVLIYQTVYLSLYF